MQTFEPTLGSRLGWASLRRLQFKPCDDGSGFRVWGFGFTGLGLGFRGVPKRFNIPYYQDLLSSCYAGHIFRVFEFYKRYLRGAGMLSRCKAKKVCRSSRILQVETTRNPKP